MSDLCLGVSTWCFNGTASDEVRMVVDAGAPLTQESLPAVTAYYHDLVDILLTSDVKAVELWHCLAYQHPWVLAEIERLAQAGLVHSYHGPFGRHLDLSSLDADIRRAGVNACKSAADILIRLGGKTLVIHASSLVENPDEMQKRERQSSESIAEIADHCAGLGVNLAVEILAGKAVGSSGSEIFAILELAGRPNTGVCIDVNHVFPPDRLVPTVYLLNDGILTLHISDYDGISERHWLPMQGMMDWPGMINALKKVNYPGPFLYEVRFEAPTISHVIARIQANYDQLMG